MLSSSECSCIRDYCIFRINGCEVFPLIFAYSTENAEFCIMNKIKKLKICDWSLISVTTLMLLSSILLEATGSCCHTFVWIHMLIGLFFMSECAWHIYLHYGLNNWLVKFHKNKSIVTKLLWWLCILTLLSGLIAMVHWITTGVHSPFGGVHGKIGFVMLILAIGHILKRVKFFKPKVR